MTLTVKLTLIVTLILSIILPFGYYLIGEKNKKRYKKAIGVNIFFYFGAFVIAGIMMFGGSARLLMQLQLLLLPPQDLDISPPLLLPV